MRKTHPSREERLPAGGREVPWRVGTVERRPSAREGNLRRSTRNGGSHRYSAYAITRIWTVEELQCTSNKIRAVSRKLTENLRLYCIRVTRLQLCLQPNYAKIKCKQHRTPSLHAPCTCMHPQSTDAGGVEEDAVRYHNGHKQPQKGM